jgi:hypothetical protein
MWSTSDADVSRSAAAVVADAGNPRVLVFAVVDVAYVISTVQGTFSPIQIHICKAA